MLHRLRTLLSRRTYQPWSAVRAFDRLLQGTDPWIAVGDFLDDWRSASMEQRPALIRTPIASVEAHPEYQRWAAFFAAIVEYVSQEASLPVPGWVTQQEYILTTPWYLYRGKRSEWLAFQEETYPEPFRRRKIFGGDRILARA